MGQPLMSIKTFAKIMLDFTGDPCACNFGDTANWLSEVCDIKKGFGGICPDIDGVGCWEQYIIHYEDRAGIWKDFIKKAVDTIETEKKCVLKASHATNPCDRNCANCELVLPCADIVGAYNIAIDTLNDLLARDDLKWS